MLYLLTALLLFVFFLPDMIGPIPAIAVGSVIIGCAFFVYNSWSKGDDHKTEEHIPE